MINTVTLTNYRCFNSLQLGLRPLTVITGPNAVGKSAILEAIASLSDPLLDVSSARNIDAPRDEEACVEATIGPMTVRRTLDEFFTGDLGCAHILSSIRTDSVSNSILANLDIEIATAVLDQARVLFSMAGISNAFSVHSPAPLASTRAPRLRVRSMSEGIAAALPIFLTLVHAEPDDLVVIEKPETLLNPAIQSVFGHMMARTVSNDVQVIVETHSEHILNGIRRAVCNNETLDASKVIIHQISSRGAASSDEISINALGQFEPKAPEITTQTERDLGAILKARRNS